MRINHMSSRLLGDGFCRYLAAFLLEGCQLLFRSHGASSPVCTSKSHLWTIPTLTTPMSAGGMHTGWLGALGAFWAPAAGLAEKSITGKNLREWVWVQHWSTPTLLLHLLDPRWEHRLGAHN